VGGERWLPESIVPWLPGYENSSPVRVGNAAYQELQIDVFGEVSDALAQARKAGMEITERGRVFSIPRSPSASCTWFARAS
jgi:GH15 family glucan-1,4-alpha-glucosidase